MQEPQSHHQYPIPHLIAMPQFKEQTAALQTMNEPNQLTMNETAPKDTDAAVDGDSSIELEGRLVDHAIDNVLSLPAVLSEVTQMQKDQSTEIQKHQLFLATIKESFKKAVNDVDDVKRDTASVQRKIYVSEYHYMEKEKNCETLEKELDQLVRDTERMRTELKIAQEDAQAEIRGFQVYYDRMDNQKDVVMETEKSHPLSVMLQTLRGETEQLQRKKGEMESNVEELSDLLNGAREHELQKAIKGVHDELANTERRSRDKQTQVDDILLKQKKVQLSIDVLHVDDILLKQKKVQLSIDVLHKRNAAQMTRLKRQLKEVQSRNRHWHERERELQKNISDITRQLHE